MKRTPKAILEFIRENAPTTMTRDLVVSLNAKFGTAYTIGQINSIKKNNKILGRNVAGYPKGLATKVYPQEVIEYILGNYIGTGHAEMARRLKEIFGRDYTTDQIKAFYANRKLNSGLTGRFPKGTIPPNKGHKGYCPEGCEKGWFQKGNLPKNHKPVGSERIDAKDGYVLIKTAEPNVYRLKQRVIWESVNGPIPKGGLITFIDGNKLNLDIGNLRMVTKAENAILNGMGIRGGSAELFETGLLAAKLHQATKRRNARRGTPNERHES
jgi:hypothetical protein